MAGRIPGIRSNPFLNPRQTAGEFGVNRLLFLDLIPYPRYRKDKPCALANLT